MLGTVMLPVADIGDAAATELQQVVRGLITAILVVAAERVTGLLLDERAPDDEACVRRGKRGEFFAVFRVVAVAEQDQAVRPVAGLVLDVPIVRQLLQGHEHVVT